MIVRRMMVLLVGVAVLSGCAVRQVHKDHDLIRTTLLDLYTNQIIDNLIRAKNGMPIIQLDYTQATAMVTNTNSISGSDSQAVTANNLWTIPAATLAATRTIATTLTGNLGNTNANQVTIAAAPVTTTNAVYDAYLQFLDDEKNPGSLMVTAHPPQPGTAHVCRKVHGMYYWVPITYQQLFFRLALLTTAQRGAPLDAPDTSFLVAIEGIVGDPRPGQNPAKNKQVVIKVDKELPNDSGYLKFEGDPTQTQYDVLLDTTKPDGNLSASKYVTVVVGNDVLDNFKKLSRGGRARIFLDHAQPKAPTTDDMLSKISFQLQQIQLNQLRQPGSF
jgi:hypothetical protein